IRHDSDEPSDSFTMDLAKIRDREFRKELQRAPVSRSRTQRGHTEPDHDGRRKRRDPRPISVDLDLALDADNEAASLRRDRGVPRQDTEAPVGPLAQAIEAAASREKPSSPPKSTPFSSPSAFRSPAGADPAGRQAAGRLVLAVIRFVSARFGERGLKRVLDR